MSYFQEQYKFIYDTLEEYCRGIDSRFPVSDLANKIKEKTQKDKKIKKNAYATEYAVRRGKARLPVHCSPSSPRVALCNTSSLELAANIDKITSAITPHIIKQPTEKILPHFMGIFSPSYLEITAAAAVHRTNVPPVPPEQWAVCAPPTPL